MPISYVSQKIKSKTLETTTEVIIENEKLEILTDNQLGIKEIKVINDGTVINIITNNIQLFEYENRIFDAVIYSEIGENIVHLVNSLKFQSKVDSTDNFSNIRAILTTVDETRVLKVSLFIENDESRNIQVSFNDSQWNIAIDQDDKNLVKYVNLSSLRPLQGTEKAKEYGSFLDEALQIGVSVQTEMKKLENKRLGLYIL
jgi:hypothetical protein